LKKELVMKKIIQKYIEPFSARRRAFLYRLCLHTVTFVGFVVGFLNVCSIYASGASSLPPRYPNECKPILSISE
jgi:hypothetical protein